MKTCGTCRKSLPLGLFAQNRYNPSGQANQCKPCARMAVWRSQLKARYGLTIERVNEILDEQGGACAICQTEISFGRKGAKLTDSTSAHIDHCHLTNRVRGILCPGCNHGLGKFRDDSILLHRAARYLDGKLAPAPIGH